MGTMFFISLFIDINIAKLLIIVKLYLLKTTKIILSFIQFIIFDKYIILKSLIV